MHLSANLNLNESLGDRVIKVNHAGEHGAVNIYRAQIFVARYTASSQVQVLEEFLKHEQKHRRIFESELKRRGQRRCRSYLLCGIGGFVLGLLTGFLGRQAIGATTYAIEDVVLRHLRAQVAALAGKDDEAVQAIGAIIEEEEAHRDEYARLTRADRIWRALITPIIGASTEAVIWIGMHV